MYAVWGVATFGSAVKDNIYLQSIIFLHVYRMCKGPLRIRCCQLLKDNEDFQGLSIYSNCCIHERVRSTAREESRISWALL